MYVDVIGILLRQCIIVDLRHSVCILLATMLAATYVPCLQADRLNYIQL